RRGAAHRAGRARRRDRRGVEGGHRARPRDRGQGARGAALRQGSRREGARAAPRRRPAPRGRSLRTVAHDRGPRRRGSGLPGEARAALAGEVALPFSYYARLSRAQQAIYRRSDAITEIRLPQAERFAAAVDAVEGALLAEDRAATQTSSERVIGGLMEVLGAPPVRVEVLAARPHAKWGELHGLYTAERGRRPKIQLWMRTAKQKRVVAFRTYLRTLLHEVGHHLDYTVLRLEDSYHTEGFYKRESSLFHQLVTDLRRSAMPTMEEYAKRPREQRLKRLERTADEL